MNYTVASGPDGLTSADFNGDGNLDLASSNYDYNNVSVQLGNGSGGFSPAVIFYTGSYPLSITSAGYNGDGAKDILTANYIGDNVCLLLNNTCKAFKSL